MRCSRFAYAVDGGWDGHVSPAVLAGLKPDTAGQEPTSFMLRGGQGTHLSVVGKVSVRFHTPLQEAPNGHSSSALQGPVQRGHSFWLKRVRLSKHLQELCALALSLSLYRLLSSACWAYDLGISLLMSEIGNREPTSIETSPLRSPCIKLSGTWPRRSPKRSTRPANIGWFSGHCLHGAS